MIKLVQVAGIRRWHGQELILLQSEPMAAIEQSLTPYGACVLEGCVVSANGADVDISAGLISLKHPTDGWQVCQFAGVTAGTVPGHLYVDKAVTNKTYQTTGVQPARHTYTALYTAGAGALGTDEFIDVTSNTVQLRKYAEALGASTRAGWTNVFTGSFAGSAPGSYLIDMQLDKASKMLHIRGFFTLAAGTGYSFVNLASMPTTDFIPPLTSSIPCYPGSGDFGAAGAQPVLYLALASGGNLSLHLIKPTAADTPYYINYSLFIG